MWLLKGTVGSLLRGKIFPNYILVDEQDHHPHPNDSSILFVDLKRLAETSSKARELAGVLIGTIKEPKDPDVELILEDLKYSFEVFKDDTKGV